MADCGGDYCSRPPLNTSTVETQVDMDPAPVPISLSLQNDIIHSLTCLKAIQLQSKDNIITSKIQTVHNLLRKHLNPTLALPELDPEEETRASDVTAGPKIQEDKYKTTQEQDPQAPPYNAPKKVKKLKSPFHLSSKSHNRTSSLLSCAASDPGRYLCTGKASRSSSNSTISIKKSGPSRFKVLWSNVLKASGKRKNHPQTSPLPCNSSAKLSSYASSYTCIFHETTSFSSDISLGIHSLSHGDRSCSSSSLQCCDEIVSLCSGPGKTSTPNVTDNTANLTQVQHSRPICRTIYPNKPTTSNTREQGVESPNNLEQDQQTQTPYVADSDDLITIQPVKKWKRSVSLGKVVEIIPSDPYPAKDGSLDENEIDGGARHGPEGSLHCTSTAHGDGPSYSRRLSLVSSTGGGDILFSEAEEESVTEPPSWVYNADSLRLPGCQQSFSALESSDESLEAASITTTTSQWSALSETLSEFVDEVGWESQEDSGKERSISPSLSGTTDERGNTEDNESGAEDYHDVDEGTDYSTEDCSGVEISLILK